MMKSGFPCRTTVRESRRRIIIGCLNRTGKLPGQLTSVQDLACLLRNKLLSSTAEESGSKVLKDRAVPFSLPSPPLAIESIANLPSSRNDDCNSFQHGTESFLPR